MKRLRCTKRAESVCLWRTSSLSSNARSPFWERDSTKLWAKILIWKTRLKVIWNYNSSSLKVESTLITKKKSKKVKLFPNNTWTLLQLSRIVLEAKYSRVRRTALKRKSRSLRLLNRYVSHKSHYDSMHLHLFHPSHKILLFLPRKNLLNLPNPAAKIPRLQPLKKVFLRISEAAVPRAVFQRKVLKISR